MILAINGGNLDIVRRRTTNKTSLLLDPRQIPRRLKIRKKNRHVFVNRWNRWNRNNFLRLIRVTKLASCPTLLRDLLIRLSLRKILWKKRKKSPFLLQIITLDLRRSRLTTRRNHFVQNLVTRFPTVRTVVCTTLLKWLTRFTRQPPLSSRNLLKNPLMRTRLHIQIARVLFKLLLIPREMLRSLFFKDILNRATLVIKRKRKLTLLQKTLAWELSKKNHKRHLSGLISGTSPHRGQGRDLLLVRLPQKKRMDILTRNLRRIRVVALLLHRFTRNPTFA